MRLVDQMVEMPSRSDVHGPVRVQTLLEFDEEQEIDLKPGDTFGEGWLITRLLQHVERREGRFIWCVQITSESQGWPESVRPRDEVTK